MATVRVRQLTKRHGDATVVRGVDLDIGEGELLAIVGPSGCGKTSILRMFAGLRPCDGVTDEQASLTIETSADGRLGEAA